MLPANISYDNLDKLYAAAEKDILQAPADEEEDSLPPAVQADLAKLTAHIGEVTANIERVTYPQ